MSISDHKGLYVELFKKKWILINNIFFKYSLKFIIIFNILWMDFSLDYNWILYFSIIYFLKMYFNGGKN